MKSKKQEIEEIDAQLNKLYRQKKTLEKIIKILTKIFIIVMSIIVGLRLIFGLIEYLLTR